MDSSLNKLIEINASGLVLMACNAHDIWDPGQIEKHKKWVIERIVYQMEHDQADVGALSRIMDEKIAQLNFHLDEGGDLPPLQKNELKYQTSGNIAVKNEKPEFYDDSYIIEVQPESNKKKEEPPKPPKFSSKGTDMPTKLAQERKPIKKLIMEDCVQLGLISKKRAKYVVTQMAGKQPIDAEKEVVKELRENLHKQVRRLIRKDKDNPWSSPKAQEELRLEIVNTPSVRSVLFLTKDIYRERDEWLERSHNSITGRIFGSKMGLDKK
jgi:hypothetical protein